MNPVSVLFYQVAFKYFSSGCFHIHRSMYRELSKIREISDWSTKRWNQDCQVEPVIILRARCQVPASARRPGVVAGNRRKCQFTPCSSFTQPDSLCFGGKGDRLDYRLVRWLLLISGGRIETTCYSSIINRCLLQIWPVNPWEGIRGNYDARRQKLISSCNERDN